MTKFPKVAAGAIIKHQNKIFLISPGSIPRSLLRNKNYSMNKTTWENTFTKVTTLQSYCII